MALLHNRVSQKELKKKLFEEAEHRTTISFYKYAFIEEPNAFRDIFYKNLDELKVFGRIYIAQEGVNAQISIPENNFEKFKEYLNTISFLKDIRLNIAGPLDPMLIRLRKFFQHQQHLQSPGA